MAADTHGDDHRFPQRNASVVSHQDLLLDQGRIVILGIDISAEAEIAHGIEDDAIVVFLDGLQGVGMADDGSVSLGDRWSYGTGLRAG